MQNAYKKVLSNSFFYSVSSLLMAAISIFMLPLYTNNMTTDEYGMVSTLTAFSNVAIVLVTLSINAAILRYWSENREKTKEYFSSIIWICTIFAVILLGLSVLFGDTFSKVIFGGKIAFFPYVFFAMLTVAANVPFTVFTNLYQAMQKGKALSIYNLIRAVIYAALNYYFVVTLHMSTYGMLIAILITNVLTSLFSIVLMLAQNLLTLRIDFKLVLPSFRYAIPLIPHSLSSNIAVLFTKSIMSISQSLSLTGLYSTALQVGVVFDTIQSSINNAYRPWFNENVADENSKETITKMVGLLYSITCFMFLGASLFGQEFIFIMTSEEYHSAWVYIPLITFGYTTRYIYYTNMLSILYDKSSSKKAFICSVGGSIVNILGDYLLIPLLGGYGATVSFFISILFLCTSAILINKQQTVFYFPLKLYVPNLLLSITVIVIGLIPTFLFFSNKLSWINISFKVVILIIGTVILFRGYRKEVIRWISQFHRNKGVSKNESH